MVLISNYNVCKNSDNEKFMSLVVTGDLEMVESQTTGKFYATVRKENVPCTFDEATATGLIGTKMSGVICKIPCEPFSYFNKDGDQITVDYMYEYRREVSEITEIVIG